MAERTQINFQVTDDVKERWDAAVEERADYDSLSHLLRVAVEHELAGGGGGSGGPAAAVDGAVGDRLDELLDESRETNRRLDRIQSDLAPVLDAVETSETADFADLMNRIFQELPRGRGRAEVLAASMDHDRDEPTGNPAELADRLGVAEREVSKAVQQLREDMPGVVEVYAEPESDYAHYYREA